MSEDRFFQGHDDFHGVVAGTRRRRVALSPNGLRWVYQVRRSSGVWDVRRWRKRLSLLVPDLPPRLRAMLPDGLPDDPRDFARPWAQAMADQAERFRAAKPASDAYSGVIEAFDRAGRNGLAGDRVIVVPDRSAYAWQRLIRDGRGWRMIARGWSRSAFQVNVEKRIGVVDDFTDADARRLVRALEGEPEAAQDTSCDLPSESVADMLRRPHGERARDNSGPPHGV